jgi:hypothetical protein
MHSRIKDLFLDLRKEPVRSTCRGGEGAGGEGGGAKKITLMKKNEKKKKDEEEVRGT